MKKNNMNSLEKYQFRECIIDFDFHLYEPEVTDAPRVDKDVRIIEMNKKKVEFGIETEPHNDNIVVLNFGFGGIKIKRTDLLTAIDNWKKRDKILLR
jgi:hypothetical protein